MSHGLLAHSGSISRLSVTSASGGCVWLKCDRSTRVRATPLAAQLGVAAAIVLLATWWLTIRPSNTGNWKTDVAQTPYTEIDGDRVVIHYFRNFYYITRTDAVPRWQTKTVHLSNLRAVDFFTNYSGSTLICHTS